MDWAEIVAKQIINLLRLPKFVWLEMATYCFVGVIEFCVCNIYFKNKPEFMLNEIIDIC